MYGKKEQRDTGSLPNLRTAHRDSLFCIHSRKNTPQFTVRDGEIFLAETELCSGPWLEKPEDLWTPACLTMLNPAVCVAVEGAKPGDLLAVDILDIEPADVGFTGFTYETNTLSGLIGEKDWGINTRTVCISREGVLWENGRLLPFRPMIGTIGTAPAEEEPTNAYGGKHGGNMDVQEAAPGSTVYLPVEVEGALLHVGDVHSVQGDGEINSTGGIECRSLVKLRARVMKRPPEYGCVRIENEEYIMTVACEEDTDASFYLAARNLLHWISAAYKMNEKEAYLLMGQVMEARCTQFVNPTRTYICKMPKKYLK